MTAISFCVALLLSLTPDVVLFDWQLNPEGSDPKFEDAKFDVKVPSTVAGALNEAGYWGRNILEQTRYRDIDKSIFDKPWIYTTMFRKEEGMRHILRFDGINFYADIAINGTVLASADTTFGTFCVREFDVTPYLKAKNTLTVRVQKARSGDLNTGYADWNPRPLDESMGIIRPVTLIKTPDVQIEDVFVQPQIDADCREAAVLVKCLVVNRSLRAVRGNLYGSYEGGSFSLPVSLAAGQEKTVSIEQPIENPRFWFTREMGSPELYHLDVSFQKDGKISHSKTVTFGLRDIRSYVDEAGHRQFVLNGKKVLVKAGGWTDDILLQDTPETLKRQLELVADMGLNCIRFENIWGKDDTVYDLCDQMGIMALVGWSCHWEWEDYCGLPEVSKYGCINDPRSEAMAIRYMHDQLVRLRNHPSLIGWLTGSDRIPNPRLEEVYLAQFKELAPKVPYICSAKAMTSLAGPSGMKMEGPYEYVGPDYWWRDKDCGGAFGFNTETGPGMNLPQEESLRRMIGENDLWPMGAAWNYHCTASASHMNSTKVPDAVMDVTYGKAKDLKDYIHKAHALDYDSERAMYEAFRGNLPNTTGIVQWMLNSAWPSLYWQLYDWYGQPSAGYYGVKAALRPVQLVYNYADAAVYAVNDAAGQVKGEAVLKFYDTTSKLVREEKKEIVSREREPQKVFDNVQGPGFLSLSFAGETYNFYCLPTENAEYVWKKADWWGIPISKPADLTFVTALPEAKVLLRSQPVPGGYSVTLENQSDVVAFQNILKAKTADGALVPGTLWSDNFVSLAPGEKRTLTCTLPEGIVAIDIVLDGWNATLAEDPLNRARSLYENNQFSKDDRYTVATPYPTVSVTQPKGKKVKNVIFMIGDGMGFEQVSVGWVANGGQLNMDQMPYLGASRTYATDKLITDSCAGGTALAIGQKTKYGYIGIDENEQPVESNLTYAMRKGMKTGVTVTCRINDATPADFCVHGPTRKDEEGLAAQFVGSGVDFISGGGTHFWNQRSDGRNLIEEMKGMGYTFVDKLEDVAAAPGDKFLGLFEEYDMSPSLDRGPVLLETTKKAIEMLDNKKGFFLMVEGSQIDDYAHRNKTGQMVEELFDFDKVIGYVLEWAAKDGQTLVVVTADHATGGLTLLKGSLEERSVRVHFSTKGHNGIVVPVFAFGPGAENFAGVHENAEIGQIVRKLLK